ncbi:hypothetical protein CWN40_07045 [Klebsiella quasipneumoniae]|nr:hypothetical protein CWN69_18250 [Klebsiella quasipneumoniae]PLM38441.1 hypothetical protein CWN40_07045 [Klebsiella quasipneumoniae]PXI47220.1 hypothetical protein DMQ35_02620 [Klebsiella quasipneumoniae]
MIACTFMRVCRSWQGAMAVINNARAQPGNGNFFTIAQQLRFVQVCPYTNCQYTGDWRAVMNIDAQNSL